MKQIGLFINHKGFAIVVVKAEYKKFTVLDEEYKSEVGFKIIDESLLKMNKEHGVYQIIHNCELTLKNKISSRFRLNTHELNLKDSIFQICSLQGDESLFFSAKTKNLIDEIANFDEEIINHRVYGLMLAVSKAPRDTSWMLNSWNRKDE